MWNKLNTSLMVCQMSFGLSFYGVMVILTRFFLEDLNYSEADTMMVVGAFSAIGPLFAIAGGFISDKLLGSYRSLTVSYTAFTLGYLLLVIGASTTNIPLSLAGIALASYARGLKSPTYPSLFKKTFDNQEHFENSYPVNYSVNNLGALIGQYGYPLLVLIVGFNGGFLLSSAMALVAVFILIYLGPSYKNIAEKIDKEPISKKSWITFILVSISMISTVFFMFKHIDIGKNLVFMISGAAILYFIFLMFKAQRSEKLKMGTILIITVITTAFYVYYGQMMTSMNMVTINTMRGDLFGIIPIAPEAAMSMNPLWCMVAGPIISILFNYLEKKNIHPTTASKISAAFVLTTIAFGVLTYSIENIGEDVIIKPEVFLLIHFFQAFAEVLVGSFVVAFILSVTPKKIESFSVSLFSVAIALSGIVGAVFSTAIALDKDQKLTQELAINLYGSYFKTLTLWAIVFVFVAGISSLAIKKLIRLADTK